MELERYTVVQEGVVIDTATLANCTPIDFRKFSSGRVLPGATNLASVTLSWYESATEDGTYVPVYSGGAAITSTLPGTGTPASCEIPAACAPCAFLKILSNADDGESVTIVKKP